MNFPAGHSLGNAAVWGGWLPEAPAWGAAADPVSSRNHAFLFKITISPARIVLCGRYSPSHACFPFNCPPSPPSHPYHTDEETEAPSRALTMKSPESAEPGVPLGSLTPDSCLWPFPPLSEADLYPGLFPKPKPAFQDKDLLP